MRSVTGLAAILVSAIAFSNGALAAEDEPTSKCAAVSSATLDDGKVTLAPGQVICLRVSDIEGKLKLTLASGDTPKNEVLVAELSAEDGSTMLVVHNGTPKAIKYRAEFQVPGQKKWYPTSICPVHAGIMGIEQWPHAIRTMKLSNFRVISKDADMVCD